MTRPRCEKPFRIRGYNVRPQGRGIIVETKSIDDETQIICLRKDDGHFVYDVLVKSRYGTWWAISCFTREEENRFPKRLAKIGNEMVKHAEA